MGIRTIDVNRTDVQKKRDTRRLGYSVVPGENSRRFHE